MDRVKEGEIHRGINNKGYTNTIIRDEDIAYIYIYKYIIRDEERDTQYLHIYIYIYIYIIKDAEREI